MCINEKSLEIEYKGHCNLSENGKSLKARTRAKNQARQLEEEIRRFIDTSALNK